MSNLDTIQQTNLAFILAAANAAAAAANAAAAVQAAANAQAALQAAVKAAANAYFALQAAYAAPTCCACTYSLAVGELMELNKAQAKKETLDALQNRTMGIQKLAGSSTCA